MVRSLLLISFLWLTALLVKGQSGDSNVRWNREGIQIDGADNDWVKPFNFYDDGTGFNYAIANDRENLYLIFTFTDMRKMKRAMMAGWSIDLSCKAKGHKFRSEISFPAVAIGGFQEQHDGLWKRSKENALVEIYKSNLSAIRLKGSDGLESEISLSDWKTIPIEMGSDSLQHLICEMALPLQHLLKDSSWKYNEEMTLKVTVNEMSRPSGMNHEPRGDFARGGYENGYGNFGGYGGNRIGGGQYGTGMSGMGDRSGFGGRSGMGYGMSRNGGYSGHGGQPENISFKQKFTLASN